MRGGSLRFCLAQTERDIIVRNYSCGYSMPARAAFAPLEESKVVSSYPLMVNCRQVKRSVVFVFLLSLFLTAAGVAALGQSFTLAATQLSPASVGPGSSATATVALTPTMGFNSMVTLTCAPTGGQVTTSPPACLVSPTSVIPGAEGAQLSLTISTSSTTPAGTYQITVTGTSGSIVESATLFLNVADLTEDYTISVLPTTAVPSPVTAGNIANTTVTVSPLGSYTGTVTLSCLSISPVVTGAPVCSFDHPTVNVTPGTPPTATLTITTFGTSGPNPVAKKRPSLRPFYALWLGVPALMLIGLGASGGRGRRVLGIFILVAIAGGLLLVPACGSSSRNTAVNQITPTNTYTFTLGGADAHGVGPSSTPAATVSLQVTAD
jgi:hypothetical protein